jgi:hypothetical protein
VRYYFNVVNAEAAYKDPTGEFFSKVEQATARAAVLAHEYAEKGGWNGWCVQVVDERGTEIARVQVNSSG